MKKHHHAAPPVSPEAAPGEEPLSASAAGDNPTQGPGEAPAPAAAGEAVLQDRLLRLQADFDNFRKRTQRDRVETYQRANEDLLLELLPVLDHFELGLATAKKQSADPALLQGFQLVYDQLGAALRKFDVQPVDSHSGPFDPHRHEAVTQVASEEHPADHIVAQLRRGYRIGDRLLRPAQVVLSSGPANPAEPVDDGASSEGEG